jgi:hypothetical protein
MGQIEHAKTKCPCGASLSFPIKKPSFHTPSVSKVSCYICDSRFLMHVYANKDQKIPVPRNAAEAAELSAKPFERKYQSHFDIIRLSEKARARSANPLRQVVSTIVEKVSKRDNGPEFEN